MLNYRTEEKEHINASLPHLPIKKTVPERGAYHA